MKINEIYLESSLNIIEIFNIFANILTNYLFEVIKFEAHNLILILNFYKIVGTHIYIHIINIY